MSDKKTVAHARVQLLVEVRNLGAWGSDVQVIQVVKIESIIAEREP